MSVAEGNPASAIDASQPASQKKYHPHIKREPGTRQKSRRLLVPPPCIFLRSPSQEKTIRDDG